MSDRIERLENFENLMGSPAWQELRKEMVEQQLSISRQLVDAGGVKDFVAYKELAAQHRQIGVIVTYPERLATQLRLEIEQEEVTE